MALESVDLLSLLKRARSTTHARAAAESAAAVETASATASIVATAAAVAVEQKAPAPESVPEIEPESARPSAQTRVGVQEEAELAELRAELLADEVLIQRILGLLYRCKKKNPNGGYISILDMERQLGVAREGATFVMSYMKTTKVIEMDDKSRMAITVPGIDYLRGVLGLQAASSSSTESEPE